MIYCILLISLAVMTYLLYINGYLVMNNKRALVYIGSRSNNSQGAKFNRCHGSTKRVILCKENREYLFELESSVTNGDVKVILQNKKKEEIVVLDDNCKSVKIWLDEKQYYLITQFIHADGKYQVSWY